MMRWSKFETLSRLTRVKLANNSLCVCVCIDSQSGAEIPCRVEGDIRHGEVREFWIMFSEPSNRRHFVPLDLFNLKLQSQIMLPIGKSSTIPCCCHDWVWLSSQSTTLVTHHCSRCPDSLLGCVCYTLPNQMWSGSSLAYDNLTLRPTHTGHALSMRLLLQSCRAHNFCFQ